MHLCCSTCVPLVALVTRPDRAMARTLCVLLHANGEGLRNATLQQCHRLQPQTMSIAFACFYNKYQVLDFLVFPSGGWYQRICMNMRGLCKNVWTPLVQSLAQLLRVELQLEKQRRPEVPQAIHHMTQARLTLTHSEDHPISTNTHKYPGVFDFFFGCSWLQE